MNPRKSNQCNSLEELRAEIDKIDYEIIQLFSERMKYVEAVVAFKSDAESVIAEERKEQVIRERAEWAENAGLNPQTIQTIYSQLIESNIQHEMKLLDERQRNEVPNIKNI